MGEVRKFPPVINFHFGTPRTNFSGFREWRASKKKKKKKKKKDKRKSSAHFHTLSPSIFSFPPPFLQFPLFPSFLSLLFPFSLFVSLFVSLSSSFPLPSLSPFFLLSSFPPSLQNFPRNFPTVGDSPTSPITPSYVTVYNPLSANAAYKTLTRVGKIIWNLGNHSYPTLIFEYRFLMVS